MGLHVPELSKLHGGLDLTISEGRARPVQEADCGFQVQLEFIWE
jgi:hypothetical protein